MKAHINGVELAYDDYGSGQPVIFLHAFPLNRSMWSDLMTALLSEQHFRLVTLDWRGFGESEIVGPVSTMEQFADDVAGLMDHLGIEEAVLCGLSMGGYAALAFVRKYPERVRALILADTKPGADNEEGKANREQVAQVAETQGVLAIAEQQLPKLLTEDTLQHRPEIVARVNQMIDAATTAGIAAASRGMARRADTHDVLARITFPTLCIVGERDVLTTPDVTRDYARHIPGAQVTTIPHAAHLSVLEQPEQFLTAVRRFLQTLV
ncbi:MAG TPA: alpha/beta fold hydrolase [Ktedonobacteraceae bacterium]|nr:alpha/beta fold hydrolase [Ktedonobacteraceae bacterium]